MKRNIIVLGAVVIVVLASLSSVVGFQTIKSDFDKVSPLFSVRTKRAIQAEQDTVTCEYVRKHTQRTIPLPAVDSNQAILKKMIERIRKLDTESLHHVLNEAIMQAVLHGDKEATSGTLGTLLNKFQKNPEGIKTIFTKLKNTNVNLKQNLHAADPTSDGSCITVFILSCIWLLLILFFYFTSTFIGGCFVSIGMGTQCSACP